jgi:hypothetical protein
LYDKIADLNKTKDRAIEKQDKDINYQMNLFDEIRRNKDETKPFEVIRLEIRFMNKQKLKSLFSLLDIKSEFTLKDLFSSEISKKILIHYWNKIYIALKPLSFAQLSRNERFEVLLTQKKKMTLRSILSLLTFSDLIEDE